MKKDHSHHHLITVPLPHYHLRTSPSAWSVHPSHNTALRRAAEGEEAAVVGQHLGWGLVGCSRPDSTLGRLPSAASLASRWHTSGLLGLKPTWSLSLAAAATASALVIIIIVDVGCSPPQLFSSQTGNAFSQPVRTLLSRKGFSEVKWVGKKQN